MLDRPESMASVDVQSLNEAFIRMEGDYMKLWYHDIVRVDAPPRLIDRP